METIKVNVATLSHAALDWAVATCEGGNPEYSKAADDFAITNFGKYAFLIANYHPSTDHAQGGEIMRRKKIRQKYAGSVGFVAWMPNGIGPHQDEHSQFGPTPLVAGMRCLVASKYGETIDIPARLVNGGVA